MKLEEKTIGSKQKLCFVIHLLDFLDTVTEDHRIHPAHISLYLTLLYYWKQQQYTCPVDVCRDELMKRAKITGRGTYQRCLRDLHDGGYILYQPTFNRFENAKIEIVLR